MVDENLPHSQNKAKVEKNLKMSEEVMVSEPTRDTEEQQQQQQQQQQQANGQLQRVGGRQSYESNSFKNNQRHVLCTVRDVKEALSKFS